MKIDLVGTTADFPRFDLTQPLPINHLPCENRRTQGRIGEVGLTSPLVVEFSGGPAVCCGVVEVVIGSIG
jgi:hypothetical protein